uniref:peroxisomal sarcosine oxidase-like n=1 Tax=Ciona intestinalis TaxID=7719 RepID=UPI000180D0A1|nr:peroxisomal sarcosine oxidase-like [Ciona intestinalis]|eukprot:XP_009857934.2 peroxisomal sarcosine oxidase-like [Ciona intestinalis]
MEEFDVIVVGAGIIGSWTAYHLAKRGRSTLLLEQFPLLHTRGSSHGHSRILRKSYVDEHYAAMMPEAYKLWEHMETSSGISFMKTTGHLSISKVKYGHVAKVRRWCEKLRIPHSTLDSESLNKRFGLKFNDEYDAVIEPSGAVLNADRCLMSIQSEIKKSGGVVRDQEKVLSIEPVNQDIVRVRTNKNVYKCRSVVLTCGPWANELLKPLGLQLPLTVGKVFVTYFKERSVGAFSSNAGFPNLLCYVKEGNYMYGLPSDEYQGLFKFCYHHYFPIDPNERDKPQPNQENEIQRKKTEELTKFIQNHFPLLECETSLVETCIITDSPDKDYILDRHPMHRNIVFAAGMSGHAFKTSPVVGKILAEMSCEEKVSYPIHHYSVRRFNKSKL